MTRVFLRRRGPAAVGLAVLLLLGPWAALSPAASRTGHQSDDAPVPRAWTHEFPKTDFSRRAVPLDEIQSGGPSRDGIPAIDDPAVRPVGQVRAVKDQEPTLVVTLNGETRAYPLQILMWHEIVNDTLGGVPIAVTFCPLCNSGIVFRRQLQDGTVLDFGATGRLRHADLLMYDRQTESWWQQFTGTAIIGALTGTRLEMLPVRTMPMRAVRAQFGDGEAAATVLVPRDPGARRYGTNPYAGYDSSRRPFLYRGDLPEGVAPMARVVVVDGTAYALAMIRNHSPVRIGDLHFAHTPGMASPLDAPRIEWGRDIGAVTVSRISPDGERTPARHHMAFAFAFHAFHPDGRIVTTPPDGAAAPTDE